jgi:CheY-like chemotaxis protein
MLVIELTGNFKKGVHVSNILIVEDSKPLNALMTQLLKNLGYEITSAYDGNEGLLSAKELKDSLKAIFTDINMPELNGPEMIQQMIADPASYPSVPIIICSTNDQLNLIESYNFPDHVHWIPKPFKIAKAKEILEQLGI